MDRAQILLDSGALPETQSAQLGEFMQKLSEACADLDAYTVSEITERYNDLLYYLNLITQEG